MTAVVEAGSVDQFYRAYAARAYGLAVGLLPRDRITAEEIVVETFVLMWRTEPLPQPCGDTERLLLRRVRERCLAARRSRETARSPAGARPGR